ncbi:MAG: PDZ domain-containing protein [Cytophagales bacterium]|nr:PDZ domain-containing protein [Cytophagales bacterium]
MKNLILIYPKNIIFTIGLIFLSACYLSAKGSSIDRFTMIRDSSKMIFGFFQRIESVDKEVIKKLPLESDYKGFIVPVFYRKAPAYKDGLRPGDIIISIDNKSFHSVDEMKAYIGNKKEKKIVLNIYRNDVIQTISTKLLTEKKFNKQWLGTPEKKRKKLLDVGDPYQILKIKQVFQETHWSFLKLDQLKEAKKAVQSTGKPLLIVLFGSSACCEHLALNQQPYRNLITDPLVQVLIEKKFTSILILKPEAYKIYGEYNIVSNSPVLLTVSPEGKLQSYISLLDTTTLENITEFLEEGKKNKLDFEIK